MTRQEFGMIIKILRAAYPRNQELIPDRESFEVWYMLLSDLDYIVVQSAVRSYVALEKFPPSIADIRTYCTRSIQRSSADETMPDAFTAWALVRHAVNDGIYHSRERFDELPALVQKAIGSPDNLRAWAVCDVDSLESVQASFFKRRYQELLKENTDHQKIPLQLNTQELKVIGNTEERGNAGTRSPH